ncbi:ChaN family lipoprotein [Halomonas cerina]|uniref:Putative iron-regulated protein n=1 Tax=Halomonas cerina TaxID=447424 RepID=A0A839VEB8_9GAMM|nr:ChaN family lipoprotein [Halomonas cerina]MBB3191004.1 putative iron-regulated protein [Halomonas cerina]
MPPAQRPRALTYLRASGLALLISLGLPLTALAERCPMPGQWQRGDGTPVATDILMEELAGQRIVLLGEQHDRLAHHRWQLHTLAGLHALRPELVIGLEMLPREAQPALDAWVAGELGEAAFLEASGWQKAWGLDPALYLPILHFARMHRIPLVALNVTPALRGRLAGDGWERVPAGERHGITPPTAPPPAYRQALAEDFERHGEGDRNRHTGQENDAGHAEAPGDERHAALERFIAAQLVWDRAMASALAEASEDGRLAVGLMGLRHLSYGHGVPHQLAGLGVAAQRAVLPREMGPDCQAPPGGLADAFFLLGDEARHTPPEPPRLGVQVGPHPEGVRIEAVTPGSVAEAAGLAKGDVLLAAAGRPLDRPGELVERVRRQPPGTLLPLTRRRGGETTEVLARFPAP